jgi:nitrogen fixation/metabolism regulation signal transduction histidine kinase
MTKITRKEHFTRNKEVPGASGYQIRFIVFLIATLVIYTFLLLVFRKLAQIVQLPLFIPISLTLLVVFIGIAGTLYSHKFVGPVLRIRRVLDHIVEGDYAVTLRLRETDDPMMKDLAKTIGHLCEKSRHSCETLQFAAQDIFRDLTLLEEQVRAGATVADLQNTVASIREKKAALERAIRSMGS